MIKRGMDGLHCTHGTIPAAAPNPGGPKACIALQHVIFIAATASDEVRGTNPSTSNQVEPVAALFAPHCLPCLHQHLTPTAVRLLLVAHTMQHNVMAFARLHPALDSNAPALCSTAAGL
eukprot:GHUV01015793.1.p3 GENE.GHUV01015793.1~~GHUV01015793.1.p3  ORF type:complete len:119 (-),score=18.36 GHUV01015793.1:688-1044(-)